MSATAPSTDNYLVGKGKVYFDRFDDDGNSTGELDLGNDPSFALTPDNEMLEHFSSMEGIKKKDKSAVIASNLNGKFTLDEINIDNLAIALYGDGVQYLTQGDGNQVNAPITAQMEKWVKLPHRKLASGTVAVTNEAGTVHYTEDTDYEVDYTIGRIYTKTGGAIADGQTLHVDYTYQAAIYPVVYPTTRAEAEGLLRFVGNATFGFDYEIVIWRVKISASGDINFISDEWAQFEINFETLDDTENHPSSPYGMIIDIEGDTAPES